MNSIADIITILLVDDHTLVRSGIARMLADEVDMKVIGEVKCGEEAIEFIEDNTNAVPDIILMDARMPGMGGIEATRAILEKVSRSRVIAMSSVVSGVIPSQMLRAGAQAFVTKTIAIEDMLRAVRTVHEGNHYVSPEVATHLALDPFAHEGGSLFDKLSRREMQIAQLLTDGKKVSQISQYLDLSPKTVYSYRYRIFEKLGIDSDVELTILAVKHGLTDDIQEFRELAPRNRAAC